MSGCESLVFLNKSVHSVLGSVVIGNDLKHVRQTEQCVLSVSVGHHLHISHISHMTQEISHRDHKRER